MAKQKLKNRTTPMELFFFALVFAGLIAAVVGLFVNFITTRVQFANDILETSNAITNPLFSDMSKILEDFKNAVTGLNQNTVHTFSAMQAFGIITIIGVAATLVMSILKVLTDWKLMKLLLIIVGVLTLASAIISLVLIYTYVPVDLGDIAGSIVTFKSVPAVGGWLVTIGGIVGGASGLFCSFTR